MHCVPTVIDFFLRTYSWPFPIGDAREAEARKFQAGDAVGSSDDLRRQSKTNGVLAHPRADQVQPDKL